MGFPSATSILLKNATVPTSVLPGTDSGEPLQQLDILIDGGEIAAIHPANGQVPPGTAVHDMDDGLVLPAFVDLHTHLDKGHIWPRRSNPDGTWLSALLSVQDDRERNWAAADVERRMDFALRCAYAHGTAAIRTHLDSAPPQHEIAWTLFEEMRERWASRIELQAVAIVGPDELLDAGKLDSVARRVQASGGILGGSVAVHPDARQAMLRVVEKAGDLGLDLDLHCDETGEAESSALRHLADVVIETGYKGRVLAGHCSVMAVQDEKTAIGTIDRVAEAGIAVVSLPMCNMYLQDRNNGSGARTPRWRGVTLLNEFKAAGVPVAIASDNFRDPFYAYGDLDCVEVFREGARILHFDHPQSGAWEWVRAVGAEPAIIGSFDYEAEIAVGVSADLVLFRARNWTELHARPQSDRIVLRRGSAIDTTLPDYRELDDLME
ncbi:MAG: cytosine deaminase [Devosia sp.]|nr:cytosine deaminase [Devosia sp.]